jgi:hypothetical protein
MAAGELFAQLLRGGHDQIAELNHRRGAGLHGALARDSQLPDRFDDAVGLLRDGRGLPGQRQPRCIGFGIADPAAYLSIVHTRRYAAINAAQGQASEIPVSPNVPGALVPSASIRTNQGGGTEDEILALARDQVPLYLGPVRITAHEAGDVAGTLQVRLIACTECCTLAATSVSTRLPGEPGPPPTAPNTVPPGGAPQRKQGL